MSLNGILNYLFGGGPDRPEVPADPLTWAHTSPPPPPPPKPRRNQVADVVAKLGTAALWAPVRFSSRTGRLLRSKSYYAVDGWEHTDGTRVAVDAYGRAFVLRPGDRKPTRYSDSTNTDPLRQALAAVRAAHAASTTAAGAFPAAARRLAEAVLAGDVAAALALADYVVATRSGGPP